MGGTGMEPQGEPMGGDPCMHVDCGMLSDAMQATEPCCNGGGTAGGGGQMVCSRPLAAASAPCLLSWVSSVAEPQRALQDPCSSCYAQCANLPSAVMPMCQQTCDRGPCGSNMPQGEPTGGDPCMHVDCSMLSDAMQATEPCCRGGTGGDEEEGPPEW